MHPQRIQPLRWERAAPGLAAIVSRVVAVARFGGYTIALQESFAPESWLLEAAGRTAGLFATVLVAKFLGRA